jgi:hypothetical protein
MTTVNRLELFLVSFVYFFYYFQDYLLNESYLLATYPEYKLEKLCFPTLVYLPYNQNNQTMIKKIPYLEWKAFLGRLPATNWL